MILFDVRCTGVARQFGTRPSCTQLLFRVGEDTEGMVEIKCPRCKHLQKIRIGEPVLSEKEIGYA